MLFYDAGVIEGGLDGVIYREIESMERLITELRKTADKSLKLW